MKLILFFILTISFLVLAGSSDVNKISAWLIGVNFTISIFSINFTFFGYQLAKYKPIYDRISKRQWLNIAFLMVYPFFPLFTYLVSLEWFPYVALGGLPLIALSSIDNAILTFKKLDPVEFIKKKTTINKLKQYNSKLAAQIKIEVNEHRQYLENKDKFQIPSSGFRFEPVMLGLSENDIWDSLSLVNKLSLEHDDYPTFKFNLNVALQTLLSSYSYTTDDESSYEVNIGINHVSRTRFRGLLNHIAENDEQGVFLSAMSHELCSYLVKPDIQDKPCSDLTRALVSDSIWIAQKLLTDPSSTEPSKVLTTIHRIAELNVHRLSSSCSEDLEDSLDIYNISAYAHDIKELAVTALENGNHHFAYRSMEVLSYLGCNAAKVKSQEMVTAVLESIVHIGRLSRHLKIGCFWSRCLIPAESHAEEFIGHIITWLVHDFKEDGSFFMKEHAEQSISRLRGFKCILEPKNNSHPKFWIKELKDNAVLIPHVEFQSGMYGYSGKLDYSDFSNLKEYKLYGFSPRSTGGIAYSEPVPLNLE